MAKKPEELYEEVIVKPQPPKTEPNVLARPQVVETTPEIKANEDKIAQYLKDQNYKELFNTKVQLYNAKNQAQKYYQNEMQAQGVGTQGYGSTVGAGIENQAINLYGQADIAAADKNLQIEADALAREEAKLTEADNQLIQYISSAGGDSALIDTYLQNYGYKDANGNWTEQWENADASRKAYIQSMIDNALSQQNTMPKELTPEQFGQVSQQWKFSDGYNYDDFKDLATNDLGNKSEKTFDKTYGDEIERMKKLVDSGQVANGTAFVLTNGNGDTSYVVVYNGMYMVVPALQGNNFINQYGGSVIQIKYKENTQLLK